MMIIGNRIKNKLKSNKGTSIFFGLLLFLVAAILSTVMLSASVTTVKRVESDKKIEQNYLTCSSAAKLLRDAIVGTSVNYHLLTQKNNETGDTTTTPENERWSVKAKTETETDAPSKFPVFLQKYVQTFYERGATDADTLARTYTITVPTPPATGTDSTDSDPGLTPVTASCTMQGAKSGNGFDIIIKLTTGDTADDCQIVLYLTGAVEEKPQNSTDANNKTTTSIIDNTYTWIATDFIYGDEARTSEAQQ